MGIRHILSHPDERLRQKAAPVDDPRAQKDLAADMFDTMYDAGGLGLAGPQIGVMQRIFVMDCSDADAPAAPWVMINPQITWASQARADYDEGCLSLLGPKAPVTRPAEVELLWTDLEGAEHRARFSGLEAVCVQHETDHLNGILFIDHLSDAQARQVLHDFHAAHAQGSPA